MKTSLKNAGKRSSGSKIRYKLPEEKIGFKGKPEIQAEYGTKKK